MGEVSFPIFRPVGREGTQSSLFILGLFFLHIHVYNSKANVDSMPFAPPPLGQTPIHQLEKLAPV